jgi:septation ring formation regulator EzrA
MKSEAEIRKFVGQLEKLVAKPCNCENEGPIAMIVCRNTKQSMKHDIALAKWILGECVPEMETAMENLAQKVS